MRKNIAIYSVAIVLFALSLLFFHRSYNEMQTYSMLTARSSIVAGDFEKLSRQVNNVAITYPDFTRNAHISHTHLFFTDSLSVISSLQQLNDHVLDSVNIRLAKQLDTQVRAELPWLLRSNVPDSIIHHHAQKHIDALGRIDSLISTGIERTTFLFQYREQKLAASMREVKLRITIFLGIACALLLYTTLNISWQRTKRRQKEEELEKQENKFRAMVENSQDIIMIIDQRLKPLYRSPSAERITGLTNKEREKNPSLDEVHPADREKIKESLEELNQNPGKVIAATYRMKHKEGHYIWLEGTFSSLFHNDDLRGIVINLRDVSRQKTAEQEIKQSEARFRQTLDNMMEGCQIIDYDWRYAYVNDALTKYSMHSREEMLGKTMMEKYPGIENSSLFSVLLRCMTNRTCEQIENEFVFPDGTTKHFDLSIQPSAEGLFILSVDITARKKAEEEINILNRLYAFISAINQSIVHITDEDVLLQKACAIAVETGGFRLARIEMLGEDGKLNTVSIGGDPQVIHELTGQRGIDYNSRVTEQTPVGKVLRSASFEVNNDMLNDPALEGIRDVLLGTGIRSAISLPITKAGKMIGVFNLSSAQAGFFDRRETDLLLEAAGDISFALENFEKARKQMITEEQVIHKEKRFRALIEKSADLKTLTSSAGLFVYASPAVSTVFGYTEDEFLNQRAADFFHPGDVPDLLLKRTGLLEKPGASFNFQYRVRHKKGHWMWCAGTLTNMLHEPAVNALVSNFTDISEMKLAQEEKEFDKNNLDALINNTHDLLWSIDKNFRLITFNQPFYEIIKMTTGKELRKGDDIISVALSAEQQKRFKGFYTRALTGEIFTEFDVIEGPVEYTAEISFFPMRSGDEIIGTACHSRDISQRKKEEKEREKMIADLVRYSKNLEQFAYVVSHNLRSPVANILGLAHMLKSGVSKADREQSEEYLYRALEHLDIIVKDLNKILEVKSEFGQSLEEVNLQEVLDGIKLSISSTIQSEQVHIEAELGVHTVHTIKSYIHSIFYNLITNSIKYRKTGLNPVIRISSGIQNGKVVLVFSDNGMGMNLEQYGEKVFGLYQRFHLGISGKGMGLFMVKTQVETLEGSVSLRSQPGQGSEFTVELPLAAP